MNIQLLHGAIVLCIGPSNSGKTTLLNTLVAQNVLHRTEIVSSDACRLLVSDTDFIDTTNDPDGILYSDYQAISQQAFSLLKQIVIARAKLNKVSFVDATHLRAAERESYITIARKYHVPIIALVFDIDSETLLMRDTNRNFPRGKKRVEQQLRTFKYELKGLKKEGFHAVYTWQGEELNIVRQAPPLELDIGQGFDIIGDIHGCYDEMIMLIKKLGYIEQDGLYKHPEGRRLLSLGDIMSRGPKSLATMDFWYRHIQAGLAYMIDSNHGWKVARWLQGKNVTMKHGDELFVEEFAVYAQTYGEAQAAALKTTYAAMLLDSPSHYVLTANGVRKAVVTHASIKDHYINKQSKAIRDFCRYGDVQGTDENGSPIRGEWYMQHNSGETIIWGHEPKLEPMRIKRTINVDQGVVFGGKLTALRYPEETFMFVNALENYAGDDNNPILKAKVKQFPILQARDYLDGFTVSTKFGQDIYIPKEKALAALDTFSHYTLPAEQVLYIPPTMSPTPKTSSLSDFLEHPTEAIHYYRKNGVTKLIAQKKHMGSRAVIFVAKDKCVAKQMLNVESLGVITTRTGRPFFNEQMTDKMLQAIVAELLAKNYFEQHNTSYVILDCEILPWNVKAEDLIHKQYTAVAENALMDRTHLLRKLQATNDLDVQQWINDYKGNLRNAARFDAVYKNYIWQTTDLEGIQIAPFHILAHSDETNFDKTHGWHMDIAKQLAHNSRLFIETEYRIMETEADEQAVIQWWLEMTEIGHEGIVIKPFDFIATANERLLQPAIKVRGREYLRIIYGMDYTDEAILSNLKKRNANNKMRNAIKEFMLGVESLERFVRHESSARVHECVLAALALESDPIDPRL